LHMRPTVGHDVAGRRKSPRPVFVLHLKIPRRLVSIKGEFVIQAVALVMPGGKVFVGINIVVLPIVLPPDVSYLDVVMCKVRKLRIDVHKIQPQTCSKTHMVQIRSILE
jgi:hypothetical protein